METFGDKKRAKTSKNEPQNFLCNFCDYTCSKRYNFIRHINTPKHIKLTKGDILVTENEQNEQLKFFTCEYCNKNYESRNGLWKHKKTCVDAQILVNDRPDKNNKLIEYLMKENKEMKELILEIVKNGSNNTNTTINNTHTNSHNKAFNLNFFLNETCKNAMNITEFVDSIKLQLSDFINVGEVGFIEGISNIIVKNLNSLDETIRPIHCTDKKRETFYIKDENKWEKEEEDKKNLKKMIRCVAYKNEKLMKVYKETYPDYNDPESKRSDQYSKTVIEAMDTNEESRDKIIKNISKVTTINNK
jgi:hypothetical protein